MGLFVENVENILERMFNFYKVSSVVELSKQINTSQKTISNWKIRNSISAVKKKCRELGIYNEIFGDLNSNINNKSQHIGSITNSNVANNLQNQHNTTGGQNHTDTDEATFSLYKEAYKKAKENERIKEFRIYLMSF